MKRALSPGHWALAAVAISAAASPVRAAEPTAIHLDLATAIPGRLDHVRTPADKPFSVFLDNRAPAFAYRFMSERSEHGASPSGTPRAPSWQELPAAPASQTRVLHLSPACDELQQAVADVATATREAAVPALAGVARETLARHECPSLEKLTLATLGHLVGRQIVGISLAPFDRTKITVERLDPVSHDPVARWQVEIEGVSEDVRWRYRSETEMLVGEIATDLAEMIAFGLGRAAPGPLELRTESDGVYAAVVRPWGAGDVRTKVDLSGRFVWSPEVWASVASTLLAERPIKSSTAAPDVSALQALLDPSPEAIVSEDRRASARLSQDAFSADAHEHAALVVAALALREAAGAFSDLRPLLSRVAAHLSLARALRAGKPASPNGVWAEVALLALSGRSADALALADTIRAAGPPQDEWKRALRLRITGDWRRYVQRPGTVLEQREAFRAAIERRNDLFALELLEGRGPTPTDWSRLVLKQPFSVMAANTFAPLAIAAETDEAKRVFKAYTGSDLAEGMLVAELNGPGARCVTDRNGRRTVAVLGWAQWAPSLRRHLQLALHAELSAFKALGDHPAGRAAAADQDARFSKLDGYWSVIAARPKFEKRTEASDNATSRDSLESRPELPDIVEAVRARPETVSFTDWQQTYLFYVRGRQTDGIPRPDIWFRPGLPHGTTFDAARRLPYGQGAEHIEELHGMAPYSRAIATQSAARQFGLNVKPRELQGVLGPLVEYDLAAARAVLAAAVASELDVDVWHDRLCEMDADSCSQAGFYFAARGEDARALRAYERAMAEARDPVGVANDVNWLVDYYLDHGRRDDALRAATFAADVYSSAGLKALARLMERLGRYDDAGAWYHRLVERYEDEDTIAQFYLRYRERVGGDRYQAEAQAALAKVFPQGLTKTTLADFREAPPDENGFGWRVMTRGMTEQLRRAGLQPGDLVVAADGYRVRDANQWVTIRSFRDDPTVSLIVWRGDRYITLDGPYVRQKFGPVDALPAGAHP